eukprot:CAMPEP_0197002200 /NCGR_PEP_ID=MMETSP1380-20130617/6735_1 /TAXON_ID=5936 /ORGANISM="Euplotes crassus, Strain CT5" /LENGTH=84 /DNA_ID=CAMNT_0042420211 /DNA_START=252 /DNA_END=506 /DNA_ORIENTATION=+
MALGILLIMVIAFALIHEDTYELLATPLFLAFNFSSIVIPVTMLMILSYEVPRPPVVYLIPIQLVNTKAANMEKTSGEHFLNEF